MSGLFPLEPATFLIMEQASLPLIQLLDRGMSMAEAKKKLGLEATVTPTVDNDPQPPVQPEPEQQELQLVAAPEAPATVKPAWAP